MILGGWQSRQEILVQANVSSAFLVEICTWIYLTGRRVLLKMPGFSLTQLKFCQKSKVLVNTELLT
jgi:hypothetical protein